MITLAITVYNRYEMLLESFAGVIYDHRIDEILISDDHSEDKYWNKIKELPKFNPKIKVVRQEVNKGMSVNKRDAVFNSKNELVIIFDSDNIIGKDYLDALEIILEKTPYKTERYIFCPSFAKPHFDYRAYSLMSYHSKNKPPLNEPLCNCLFNTCNYVVNRESYLKVWQENAEMKGSDTIWFNYLWLKAGNAFFVVPKMEYEHRVHDGSGFAQDMSYNMAKAEEVKKLIMAL